MKKMIITKKQMNLLEGVMDSEKTEVAFTGNNANELGTNAQEKYNDAVRAGLKPNSITMDGKTKRNNSRKGEEVSVSFKTDSPSIKASVTDTVNNAVNNGVDINKLNITGNAEDIYDGNMDEGKTFTKSFVENARLFEMRKNGKIVKKEWIKEGRMETSETNKVIRRLYKNTYPFTCHKYHDSAWENTRQVFESIRNTIGVSDLTVYSGQYQNMFDNERPASRTYKLEIELDCGVTIGGELKCHSAGTVEDPFSSYDMTCMFFKLNN